MASEALMQTLAATKKAARALQNLPNAKRQELTMDIAAILRIKADAILAANAIDLQKMALENPLYDRLQLTPSRLEAIADGIHTIAALPDPCGVFMSSYQKENGLLIDKITVPLGVVGAIYEARPNVTMDIAALCLRSGNAVVLKGGSDAYATNQCMVQEMQAVLADHGLPEENICLLPPGREGMTEWLQATQYIDVIIPRGSQSLIDFVRQTATVPVIETGAGVCHTYVHRTANLAMAAAIVVNAKTQRPSVCNALDTILADKEIADDFLPLLIPDFLKFNVNIFADETAYTILTAAGYPHIQKAAPEDFGREYLSQQCSIKIVAEVEAALEHIALYSSKHSEAIVCESPDVAEYFLRTVDAAAVYHNASTRFTDGAEFGLGAEVGISTQKLHARGPFALEKLVCEKWIIRGDGQIRK